MSCLKAAENLSLAQVERLATWLCQDLEGMTLEENRQTLEAAERERVHQAWLRGQTRKARVTEAKAHHQKR